MVSKQEREKEREKEKGWAKKAANNLKTKSQRD
jgi:hypothetical protein